jgi:hypothetical protein
VVIVLIAAILAMKVMEPRMKAREEKELRNCAKRDWGDWLRLCNFTWSVMTTCCRRLKIGAMLLRKWFRRASGRSFSIAQNLRAKAATVTPSTPTHGTTSTMLPRWHPEMYPPSEVVLIYETTQTKRNAVGTGKDIPNPGRHNGYNLFLFADGSTMALTPEEFKEMLEKGELRFKPLKPPTR